MIAWNELHDEIENYKFGLILERFDLLFTFGEL